MYQKSKYRAKKVEADGLIFDSKKEYKRWRELKALQEAGAISDLRRQVKYVLIPAAYEPDQIGPKGGKIKGKLIERECAYIADFVYLDDEGIEVVEDTKGMRTPEYVIKRKLMFKENGIRIHEV